jgi:hypothetical protein
MTNSSLYNDSITGAASTVQSHHEYLVGKTSRLGTYRIIGYEKSCHP